MTSGTEPELSSPPVLLSSLPNDHNNNAGAQHVPTPSLGDDADDDAADDVIEELSTSTEKHTNNTKNTNNTNDTKSIFCCGMTKLKFALFITFLLTFALLAIIGVTLYFVEFRNVKLHRNDYTTHPIDRHPVVYNLNEETMSRDYQRDLIWIDSSYPTEGNLVTRLVYKKTLPPQHIEVNEYLERNNGKIELQVSECADLNNINFIATFPISTFTPDEFYIKPDITAEQLEEIQSEMAILEVKERMMQQQQQFESGDNKVLPIIGKLDTTQTWLRNKLRTQRHNKMATVQVDGNDASETSPPQTSGPIHFPLFQPNNTLSFDSLLSPCYRKLINDGVITAPVDVSGQPSANDPAYRIKSISFTNGSTIDNMITTHYITTATPTGSISVETYGKVSVKLELELVPDVFDMIQSGHYAMDVLGRWDPTGEETQKRDEMRIAKITAAAIKSQQQQQQGEQNDSYYRNDNKTPHFDDIASKSGLVFDLDEDGDVIYGSGEYRQFNHLDYPILGVFNRVDIIYDSIDNDNVLLDIGADEQHDIEGKVQHDNGNGDYVDGENIAEMESLLSPSFTIQNLSQNNGIGGYDSFKTLSDVGGYAPFTIPMGMQTEQFVTQRVANSRTHNAQMKALPSRMAALASFNDPNGSCTPRVNTLRTYDAYIDPINSPTAGFAVVKKGQTASFVIVCATSGSIVFEVYQFYALAGDPLIIGEQTRRCGYHEARQRYEAQINIPINERFNKENDVNLQPFYVNVHYDGWSYNVAQGYNESAEYGCGVGAFFVVEGESNYSLSENWSGTPLFMFNSGGDLVNEDPTPDSTKTSNDIAPIPEEPNFIQRNAWKIKAVTKLAMYTLGFECEEGGLDHGSLICLALGKGLEYLDGTEPKEEEGEGGEEEEQGLKWQFRASVVCTTCLASGHVIPDGIRWHREANFFTWGLYQIEGRLKLGYALDVSIDVELSLELNYTKHDLQLWRISTSQIPHPLAKLIAHIIRFDFITNMKLLDLEFAFGMTTTIPAKARLNNMYMAVGFVFNSQICSTLGSNGTICTYNRELNAQAQEEQPPQPNVPISLYDSLNAAWDNVEVVSKTRVGITLGFVFKVVLVYVVEASLEVPIHLEAQFETSTTPKYNALNVPGFEEHVWQINTCENDSRIMLTSFVELQPVRIGVVADLDLSKFHRDAVYYRSWFYDLNYPKRLLLLTGCWLPGNDALHTIDALTRVDFDRLDRVDKKTFQQRTAAALDVDPARISIVDSKPLDVNNLEYKVTIAVASQLDETASIDVDSVLQIMRTALMNGSPYSHTPVYSAKYSGTQGASCSCSITPDNINTLWIDNVNNNSYDSSGCWLFPSGDDGDDQQLECYRWVPVMPEENASNCSPIDPSYGNCGKTQVTGEWECRGANNVAVDEDLCTDEQPTIPATKPCSSEFNLGSCFDWVEIYPEENESLCTSKDGYSCGPTHVVGTWECRGGINNELPGECTKTQPTQTPYQECSPSFHGAKCFDWMYSEQQSEYTCTIPVHHPNCGRTSFEVEWFCYGGLHGSNEISDEHLCEGPKPDSLLECDETFWFGECYEWVEIEPEQTETTCQPLSDQFETCESTFVTTIWQCQGTETGDVSSDESQCIDVGPKPPRTRNIRCEEYPNLDCYQWVVEFAPQTRSSCVTKDERNCGPTYVKGEWLCRGVVNGEIDPTETKCHEHKPDQQLNQLCDAAFFTEVPCFDWFPVFPEQSSTTCTSPIKGLQYGTTVIQSTSWVCRGGFTELVDADEDECPTPKPVTIVQEECAGEYHYGPPYEWIAQFPEHNSSTCVLGSRTCGTTLVSGEWICQNPITNEIDQTGRQCPDERPRWETSDACSSAWDIPCYEWVTITPSLDACVKQGCIVDSLVNSSVCRSSDNQVDPTGLKCTGEPTPIPGETWCVDHPDYTSLPKCFQWVELFTSEDEAVCTQGDGFTCVSTYMTGEWVCRGGSNDEIDPDGTQCFGERPTDLPSRSCADFCFTWSREYNPTDSTCFPRQGRTCGPTWVTPDLVCTNFSGEIDATGDKCPHIRYNPSPNMCPPQFHLPECYEWVEEFDVQSETTCVLPFDQQCGSTYVSGQYVCRGGENDEVDLTGAKCDSPKPTHVPTQYCPDHYVECFYWRSKFPKQTATTCKLEQGKDCGLMRVEGEWVCTNYMDEIDSTGDRCKGSKPDYVPSEWCYEYYLPCFEWTEIFPAPSETLCIQPSGRECSIPFILGEWVCQRRNDSEGYDDTNKVIDPTGASCGTASPVVKPKTQCPIQWRDIDCFEWTEQVETQESPTTCGFNSGSQCGDSYLKMKFVCMNPVTKDVDNTGVACRTKKPETNDVSWIKCNSIPKVPCFEWEEAYVAPNESVCRSNGNHQCGETYAMSTWICVHESGYIDTSGTKCQILDKPNSTPRIECGDEWDLPQCYQWRQETIEGSCVYPQGRNCGPKYFAVEWVCRGGNNQVDVTGDKCGPVKDTYELLQQCEAEITPCYNWAQQFPDDTSTNCTPLNGATCGETYKTGEWVCYLGEDVGGVIDERVEIIDITGEKCDLPKPTTLPTDFCYEEYHWEDCFEWVEEFPDHTVTTCQPPEGLECGSTYVTSEWVCRGGMYDSIDATGAKCTSEKPTNTRTERCLSVFNLPACFEWIEVMPKERSATCFPAEGRTCGTSYLTSQWICRHSETEVVDDTGNNCQGTKPTTVMGEECYSYYHFDPCYEWVEKIPDQSATTCIASTTGAGGACGPTSVTSEWVCFGGLWESTDSTGAECDLVQPSANAYDCAPEFHLDECYDWVEQIPEESTTTCLAPAGSGNDYICGKTVITGKWVCQGIDSKTVDATEEKCSETTKPADVTIRDCAETFDLKDCYDWVEQIPEESVTTCLAPAGSGNDYICGKTVITGKWVCETAESKTVDETEAKCSETAKPTDVTVHDCTEEFHLKECYEWVEQIPEENTTTCTAPAGSGSDYICGKTVVTGKWVCHGGPNDADVEDDKCTQTTDKPTEAVVRDCAEEFNLKECYEWVEQIPEQNETTCVPSTERGSDSQCGMTVVTGVWVCQGGLPNAIGVADNDVKCTSPSSSLSARTKPTSITTQECEVQWHDGCESPLVCKSNQCVPSSSSCDPNTEECDRINSAYNKHNTIIVIVASVILSTVMIML